jgi:hypothetical protein
MAAQLLVNNDNNVLLQGYQLASTGTVVTDAEASFTVYLDEDLTRPASGLSGVTMSFVTGTSGNYVGLIPGTAALTPGASYWIVVTFANYNDQFVASFEAAVRTGANG